MHPVLCTCGLRRLRTGRCCRRRSAVRSEASAAGPFEAVWGRLGPFGAVWGRFGTVCGPYRKVDPAKSFLEVVVGPSKDPQGILGTSVGV
eukprot:12883293-Prorocentrum_lima.AAC.1